MQSSTKKNLLIAALYAGTIVLGMILGPKFQKENAGNRVRPTSFLKEDRVEKVDQILNLIEENYVDPVKVDTLQDMAINQILNQLDPHSAYLPPVEARHFSEDLDGNYSGIGVEYQILNDTVFVTAVHKGGPAAKEGIKPGDLILQVNGAAIAGQHKTSKEIISLIKGRKGSEVRLLIKSDSLLHKVSVKRDKIIISSVDVAYSLTDKVGYIKISKFGARTDDDFADVLGGLRKKGIENLVLDLRGNGGGYLNAATALADQFLPEKKLIVYTKGEHEPRRDYFATARGSFENGKLIVLIDEHSASASEILAGAIQDLDRGLIIGRRSFGKGLVQEQFNFGDGSALNLTVARYYTPSGRSIQKPYNKGSEKYFAELKERNENGETSGKQTDSLTKHKKYKTASGRLIYDGGGISPDIHVPVDTSARNGFYYALNARGLFAEFAYRYLVKPGKYSSLSDFMTDFKLSDAQFQKLQNVAAARSIKFTATEAQKARPAIYSRIKALAARYYFGDEGFFKVANAGDKVIARALEAIQKP